MRLAWVWWGVLVTTAYASPESRFIGGERCRLCHRAIYRSWLQTPHARRSEVPSESAECVTCHDTASVPTLRAVQCEACHGAGEDYSPPEVMIDRDKAVMAGLVRPSETVCRRCHAAGAPGHAETFRMPLDSEFRAAVHQRSRP